jgi:preprotein translocase subunit SecF
MKVIENKKIFFIISGVTVGLSILFVLLWGLVFGIDFTGGAITEVTYESRPEKEVVEERLDTLATLGAYSLRASGENNYILRTKDLAESERLAVNSALALNDSVEMEVERFNSIGPIIGEELRNKAFFAIGTVMLAIIFFIAFTFRHVSKPVSSWKYGSIAIVALFHDIIIPVGLFAFLGQFFGAEVDVLFVMALLAILGYSVNDTIVVFDRVRENLRTNEEANIREPFEETVGHALNQTYVRSLNTSVTTGLVLIMLFLIGGETTKWFALTLLSGVVAGTYSSIFLATPLLVWVNEQKREEPKKKKK